MSVVKFEKDGDLGHIVLDNPPFNWIGEGLRDDLRQALHEANEANVRALLIRPVGPSFSSGGAVHEWIAHPPTWLRTFLIEIVQSYRAIDQMQVPVVAAVRGNVFGGGLELALACDFIVASENTVIWSLEVKAGIIPLGGAVQRLAERAGGAVARRIAMLGEKTPITEVPMVADHIVPDAALDQFALDFATRLSKGPTKAYASIKAVLKAYSLGGVSAADRLQEDLTGQLFMTQDVQKGMAGIVPVYMQVSAPGYVPPATGWEFPETEFTGS